MMQGSGELAQALKCLDHAFTGNVANGFEDLLSSMGRCLSHGARGVVGGL